MSKFRDPPPPGSDKTVIPFPGAEEMSPARLKAELDAHTRAAHAECMLRLEYQSLLQTLDRIERLPPVPDDWRARLQDRAGPDEAD